MTCSTCGAIPPSLVANTGREEYLPVSTRALHRLDLDRDTDLWQCLECRALYEWEDDSSWTGSGNHDSESLTRLVEPHAETVRSVLGGGDLAYDAVFALPTISQKLVLSFLFRERRPLVRAWAPRLAVELSRRGTFPPDTFQLRDILRGLVEGDPELARELLAVIDGLAPKPADPLSTVASACRQNA